MPTPCKNPADVMCSVLKVSTGGWRQRTGPEAGHEQALQAARDDRRVGRERLKHGRHVHHLVRRQPRRATASVASELSRGCRDSNEAERGWLDCEQARH